MTKQSASFALLLFAAIPVCANAEVVVSNDGREVRLNSDGTWEFVSQDRFATKENGERIKLRDDGSWEIVQRPMTKPEPVSDVNVVESDVSVGDFVIEAVRSSKHKNSRVRKQMLVDILLDRNRVAVDGLSPADFDLRDSKGRVYGIKAVQPSSQGVRLFVDDSPNWWGVKYFEITIPQAVTTSGKRTLRKSFADVIRRDVPELTR